jgi:hypothetical protein
MLCTESWTGLQNCSSICCQSDWMQGLLPNGLHCMSADTSVRPLRLMVHPLAGLSKEKGSNQSRQQCTLQHNAPRPVALQPRPPPPPYPPTSNRTSFTSTAPAAEDRGSTLTTSTPLASDGTCKCISAGAVSCCLEKFLLQCHVFQSHPYSWHQVKLDVRVLFVTTCGPESHTVRNSMARTRLGHPVASVAQKHP